MSTALVACCRVCSQRRKFEFKTSACISITLVHYCLDHHMKPDGFSYNVEFPEPSYIYKNVRSKEHRSTCPFITSASTMLTPNYLTVAAITTFSIRLINAIPAAPASLSPPVLYTWSTDPVCKTTGKQSDCETAYQTLCARPDLTTSDNTTVGDCTAFYQYDAGNLVPTAATCTAAYEKILDASIGGGAWGYNADETRTDFPLYAVYPKDGNGNCFKAAGDTSPVLAMDALPGGGTLPTCPVSSSRL